MPNWEHVNSVRLAVEKFYQEKSEHGLIVLPVFDLYITRVREDWERAGFDLTSEEDLFKLWGVLTITCEAGGELLGAAENSEQLRGALRVFGTFSNMTGMFLREMTRFVPSIPPPHEKETDD